MLLKSLTNGNISGTGPLTCESTVFGGALVSTDGINAAAVSVRKDNASGAVVFSVSTKSPIFICGPFQAAAAIYYSISGTGASAQLYEWVN